MIGVKNIFQKIGCTADCCSAYFCMLDGLIRGEAPKVHEVEKAFLQGIDGGSKPIIKLVF